uniref:Uncharacterized protein n=1 Tax=Tetraselmis sp. GSL018 TaxID=582737 RepID=A0A061R4I2_9CHLO
MQIGQRTGPILHSYSLTVNAATNFKFFWF